MGRLRKHRPSPATAVALAALVVALGGAAFAAIPDSSGTIHACYHKTNGNLRLIEASSRCRPTELAVDWDQGRPPNANVRAISRITIGDGESKVLFEQGPFTFTVRCETNVPVVDSTVKDLATISVSTTEEHSQPGDFGPGDPPGPTLLVDSIHSGNHHDNYQTRSISLSTPSGFDLGGQLYAAVNAFGKELCSFGGYVVASS